MRDPKLKNIPASIRQKLLNLARERNEDFAFILTKYGLERILFRLSKSKYRQAFILKGALLFEIWTFLAPVIRSAQQQRTFGSTWTAVHGWQPAPDQ